MVAALGSISVASHSKLGSAVTDVAGITVGKTDCSDAALMTVNKQDNFEKNFEMSKTHLTVFFSTKSYNF